jgi:hypothetical protein
MQFHEQEKMAQTSFALHKESTKIMSQATISRQVLITKYLHMFNKSHSQTKSSI